MVKKQPMLGFIERLTRLPYSSLFSLWLGMAFFFGFLYFVLASFVPEHGPTQLQEDVTAIGMFLDSLYYSIITATSTGYGDITPQGLSKVLASLQSIMALLVFAVFVTKLVSHKQELALQDVHRLTFEDVFHNTREGLYIIRKDCDRVIEDARHNQSLTDDHWTDLTIAYQHMQSLLQEIPDFYAVNSNSEDGLYTIDERREELLHEAVHRTLRRINTTLNALSENDVQWAKHEPSMRELMMLIDVVHEITPMWQSESPYNKTEAFADILDVNKTIHGQVDGMLS